MRNQFSLLAFLCKIPVDLLEVYLEDVGLADDTWGACIPWETIKALGADRSAMAFVRQAIVEAPTALRERIIQDFMDVDALADGRGIEYLLTTGRCQAQPVDLSLHLAHYDGSHARALFALMEFSEIFHSALRFAHVESLPASRWHKTGRIDGADADVSARRLESLRDAISAHFRRQCRGKGCEVDVEDRGDDLYVFAFPEDYARRRFSFNAQHKLVVETVRPAFEVIFVYHRPNQTLELYASGGARDRAALKRCFGRAILGVELGSWAAPRRVYDLDPLKHPRPFPVMPDDGVVAVKLRRLGLRDAASPEAREMVLSSQCREDADDLYRYIEELCARERIPFARYVVTRASFQLVFQRRQDHGRIVTRTFSLSAPNTHTYRRNDPYAPKIQELLTRWKIDVAHDVRELAG